MAIGLLLRVWGIEFGLPHTETRPDEGVLIRKALSVAAGDLNPHFFNYPSFHIYTLSFLFGVLYLCGLLGGVFTSTQDFLLQYFTNPSWLYMSGRLLGAVLGTATVYLVYLLGQRLVNPRTGLLSSAFLAVAFLHVRDSHYLTVDVPASCYLLLAFLLLLKFLDNQRNRWLIASAVATGVAASTKYNTVILAPVVVGYLVLATRRHWVEGIGPIRSLWRQVATFSVVAGLAAVAGTPYAVIDTSAFLRDVMFERAHFVSGHGADLGWGWSYHVFNTLPAAVGWPVYAAGIIGCALLLRGGGLATFVPVAFVWYLAVSGGGKTVFFRYMIPVLPLLCVAAGCAVDRLCRGVAVSGRWWLPVAILFAAPAAIKSVQLDLLLQRTDTRVLAAEWIEQHVPNGSTIAMVGSDFGYPQIHVSRRWLQQQRTDLQRAGFPAQAVELKSRMPGYPPHPNYNLISVRPENPLGLTTIQPSNLSELVDEGVTWVVTQEHPLPVSQLDGTFASELSRMAVRTAEFVSVIGDASIASFEITDAFYLPYSGFRAIRRPGPTITVFRIKKNFIDN